MRTARWLFLLLVTIRAIPLLAAEPTTAPAVSTFAPATELIGLLDEILATLAKQLASPSNYQEAGPQVSRTAHTLSVVALALALSDESLSAKPSAGALLKASQALAEATDFAAATAAFQLVQAARQATTVPVPTAWETVAPTGELMTQVQTTHNRLKRSTRGARFESLAKENAQSATLLALIAHQVRSDTNQVEDSDQLPQWLQFCDEMRDAASALRTSITSGDRSASEAALTRLENNCKACHQVFHPDEP